MGKMRALLKRLAQAADGAFTHLGAAQLFGDGGHFAGGNTLHDHLHHGQHEGLFASLVALEDVATKAAVAQLGHLQLQGPHPRVQRAHAGARAVGGALCVPLVSQSPGRFVRLCSHHLVENALHQLGHCAAVSTEQSAHNIVLHGNINRSHRLTPSSFNKISFENSILSNPQAAMATLPICSSLGTQSARATSPMSLASRSALPPHTRAT